MHIKKFVTIHLEISSCSFHGFYSGRILEIMTRISIPSTDSHQKNGTSRAWQTPSAWPATIKSKLTDRKGPQGQNTSGFESTCEPASSLCGKRMRWRAERSEKESRERWHYVSEKWRTVRGSMLCFQKKLYLQQRGHVRFWEAVE